MAGLREVGLVGAALALTGGLVYIVWNLLSATGKKKLDKKDEIPPKQEKIHDVKADVTAQAPVQATVVPEVGCICLIFPLLTLPALPTCRRNECFRRCHWLCEHHVQHGIKQPLSIGSRCKQRLFIQHGSWFT